MKKITTFILAISFVLSIISCGEMSRKERIQNDSALKELKKIALINFAVNTSCPIGSGEDAGSINSLERIQNFAKIYLIILYDSTKTLQSPSFFDLNEMFSSQNYQNLSLSKSYVTGRRESLPKWLSPGKTFVNVIDNFGVIKLNTENTKEICSALNVDGVLSVELSYALDDGFSLPFVKPDWSAMCETNIELFNNRGELVWRYEFNAESPLEVKADESTNLLIYSSSSITGQHTNDLINSVSNYSSQKVINTLYEDIINN